MLICSSTTTFSPPKARLGGLCTAVFPGQITIRSDMDLPGIEDDLLIQTSNLEMNDTRIQTEDEVMARIGPNIGRGRSMMIRLLRDQHIKHGPSIVGIKSLEVFKNVKLELDPGEVDLFDDAQP